MQRVNRTLLLGAVLLLGSCTGARSNTPGNGLPAGGGTTAGSSTGATATPDTRPAPVTNPPQKFTEVEGITEYRLDNGLRVLLFPDDSQAKVTVNITYFVGSKQEGFGETGMAHLLEHMVFKGTPSHPDIWKQLNEHGANFNGTTWVDRTNYFETLPASDENLEFALALEADRMINSKIAAEDLATEFSVVRNEFELGENSPRDVLIERMHSAAYLWHNYGKSTIGNKSDIERVPVDNLRRFYSKYYQPDNAMLVVAGRFDEKRALDLVKQHFGVIPRPERKLAATYTVEPVQDGERHVTLRRVGEIGVVGVLYHGLPGAHEDFVAADAIAEILTDEPSGRLYTALVKSGMATAVYGFAWNWADPGTMQFYAEVAPGKPLEPVRDKMLAIIEGLGKSGVSAAELDRYKARARKNLRLAMTNSQRIAVELSEWAALGDWRMLFVHRDRTEALDVERVKRVALEYLKRANRTLGMFVPSKEVDRAPLPEMPDVAALTRDYKGKNDLAEGETFEATAANVDARTRHSSLPGGAKLALLAKETRGDAVKMAIAVRFGSERDLAGKTSAAELLPSMLIRGTRKHSYQELRDELDRLQAQVQFSSPETGAALVTVTTTRDNVSAVLDLVAEMLKQPAFPAAELDIIKKERLSELEEAKTDPFQLASNRVQRQMSPYPRTDVRYVPTLDEEIAGLKKVKASDLASLHSQLWGAGSAQFTVVGDFDADEVSGALARHFGSWKARRPYQRIARRYVQSAPGSEVIETPDKKNSIIIAGHTFAMRDDDPDYPALEMAGYILGGSASSRLLDRLRQKEGLSYGAFGGVQVDDKDADAVLFTGAIVNPDNAEKAMSLMVEEIERLIRDGVSDDELAKAKESYVLRFKNRLASDDFLARTLNHDLYIDRTMSHYDGLHAAMAKLTAADIARVVKKHLQPAQLFRVRAGDFAKK